MISGISMRKDWTAFSIFFEWLNIKNAVFTYTGWEIYYSIPTYPISSLLLIKVFHFTKMQLSKPIPNIG
jgi:ABC-type multidrug transport system permease subunit